MLRGGYGIYYDPLSANVNSGLSTGPFAISTTATNSFVNGQPLYTLANPFAAPGSSGTLNVNAISPALLNAYVQQYSLTLERAITRDIGIRVSFDGSKASQLIYKRNVNQPLPSTTPFKQASRPYPIFNNIIYADNGADMLYNALQVQVTKRFTKSLMFTSSWTWAKELSTIDDTGYADLNTQIQNAYNRNADLGNVYAVPRHQWMNNFLYELPFGKGKLLGGWQLNGLLDLQSGNWLTPVYSGADPSNTNNLAGRADVIGTPNNPHTLNSMVRYHCVRGSGRNTGRFRRRGTGHHPRAGLDSG